jgi:CPA1 family monovalent cation:H+ antiporter
MGAESIQVILGLLLVVGVLAHLATYINIPYPIVLVVAGTVLAAIPGLPEVVLNPNVVFYLLLPPILYYSGLLTSWREFFANIRPIAMLAVGLVLVTTLAIAAAIMWVFPAIGWPAAIVLGAIISPPDAAAAVAICQRMAVPKRVTAILEGESLVNDATALVTYKIGVAAAMAPLMGVSNSHLGEHVDFSFLIATRDFLVIAAGGVVIGYAAALVMSFMRRFITDTTIESMVGLLCPFVAYIPAEMLHVSGVLACVTAGLLHGRAIPEVSHRARLRAFAVWDVLIFLINGLVFVLIGLQLPVVIRNIGDVPMVQLLWMATVVSVVAIVVRVVWVFVTAYGSRLIPAVRKHDPLPPDGQLFTIGWTGMRGIVSLAAALALPVATENMAGFPQRDLIIFLTFCAILATLVLQGLTLPWVIRICKLTVDDQEHIEERHARIEAAHAALSRLEVIGFDGTVSPEILTRVRLPYDERIKNLGGRPHHSLGIDPSDPDGVAISVRREALIAERRMITFLRNNKVIGDEVLRRLMNELDLEEMRLVG